MNGRPERPVTPAVWTPAAGRCRTPEAPDLIRAPIHARRESGYPRSAFGKARSSAGKRLGLMLAVFALAVVSGLQVVTVSHKHRAIHGLLEETRNYQDLLLAEHSRLLLERGALAAYHHVERVAVAELDMQFPDDVERILP